MTYTAAADWARGPGRLYDRLAVAAVHLLHEPLDGRLALDAGSGTGAATRALRARGALVVCTDRSERMVRVGQLSGSGPAFVADVARLPVRTGAVEVAAACLVLSHVADPARALAELRRVTRPGGTVLVTAWPSPDGHPVRTAAAEVLAGAGFRSPPWYRTLKSTGEPRLGTAGALRDLADAAGLHRACVDRLAVGLGGLTTADLVAWRLGLAHVAPWLATLPPPARAQLTADLTAALTALRRPPPLPLLTLRACVPPTP